MDKSKWSDIDYVKNYIQEKGYIPETDLDNLANMVILHYEGILENEQSEYYAIKDDRPYPLCLMINIADLDVYIRDNGGLKELDFYC